MKKIKEGEAYSLVKLKTFSGKMANIYAIQLKGEEHTLLYQFIQSNIEKFGDEVKNIVNRLHLIGNKLGARGIFFKGAEGKPGDLVCALYDEPESNLRLYCIRYGDDLIVVGTGGYKSKQIRAWQQDETLKNCMEFLMKVSADIFERTSEKYGDLKFTEDRSDFSGKLNFNDGDGE